MNTHIHRVDETIETYNCDICEKIFAQKRYLEAHNNTKRHKLKVENKNHKPYTTDFTYYDCPCGAKYQQRTYKSHIGSQKHILKMKIIELEQINNENINGGSS